MAFQRGGQAGEEASKAGRRNFSRTEYFSLEDGDSVIIRLLHDSPDWYYVKQHSYVDTKGAPEDWDSSKTWPTKMTAICRKDKGIGADNCYICDVMTDAKGKAMYPAIRYYVPAVLREEVLGTEEMFREGLIPEHQVGMPVGYRDVEHDVEETDAKGEPTGKKVRRKKMVLINQGSKNFFGALQGYYDMLKTVLDRDFKVIRKGTGKETDYKIMACEPIRKADGSIDHDLKRNPELRERYLTLAAEQGLGFEDIEKLLAERGSEEYYGKFFDPTVKVPARTSEGGGDTTDGEHPGGLDEFAPKPPSEDDEAQRARMAMMRERVLSGGRKPAEA